MEFTHTHKLGNFLDQSISSLKYQFNVQHVFVASTTNQRHIHVPAVICQYTERIFVIFIVILTYLD